MFRLSAQTKSSGILKYVHGMKVNVLNDDRDRPYGERVKGEVLDHFFDGILEYRGKRYLQVEVVEPGVYQSYVGQTPVHIKGEEHRPGQVLNYTLENITSLEEIDD